MRQLLIVALTAIASRAYAQTPEPVRYDDDPKPHGEPVKDPQPHGEPVKDPQPHGEHDGPYGEPVVTPDEPKQEPPKQEPPKQEPPKQNPNTQTPPKQTPNTQPPNTQTPSTQTPPKQTPTVPSPGDAAKQVPTTERLEPWRLNPLRSTTDAVGAGDIPTEGEIKKIIVEENEKTTADTVQLIARIEVGDHWTSDQVDVVKSRLVSSGLFKDVEVYWTRAEGGVAIHILAKDKHSWVIAPAAYNQPTNKGVGVGFGENNLGGKNQKLLLYGQVATGDSFFIGAWLIPNLGGTRFYGQLDTYLKSARNFEYTAPTRWIVNEGDLRPVRESRMHYLNAGGNIGIELMRGVKIGTRLRGAWVSYVSSKLAEGATIEDVFGPGADPAMPIPNPGGEGWDVSNEWSFSIDRRANWYGVQTGRKLGVAFERSLPSFGSDFDYWLLTFSGARAYQVLERHNLVLKGSFGYGHDLPFQQELQTGGTSMRGWLNNEFRGNLRALANIEYSVPVFTIHGFGVRALAFFDSAYTTFTRTNDVEAQRHYLPASDVRGLDGLKNSVGVGTRFYLRQIVLPLLGLDFGYGLEARDFQIYLAIGLTD